MAHEGIYVGLRFPGSEEELELNCHLGGNHFATRYRNGDEMDRPRIAVRNTRKPYKELMARGAKLVIGPGETKDTELHVADPDGIWIELCQASR